MVAVVDAPAPGRARGARPTERPVFVVIDSAPGRPARRPAVSPNTYRRRRAGAAAVALVVVALLAFAVHGLVAPFGSGTLTAPDRPGAAEVYVVQPGDTFWTIARRLQPDGDPRPMVSRLVAAHGGPVVHSGERIALP
jgi:nucleoid-associated protein YgaU